MSVIPYEDIALTTLDDVKDDFKISSLDADDDARIMRLIFAASDIVQQHCQRSFVPYQATVTVDARGEHIDGRLLFLDNDLLTLTTLTNGDSTTVTSAQYVLRGQGYPKWAVELLPSTGLSWTYSTDWQNAISFTGIWGYHESWPNAWVSTLDTIQDAGGLDNSTLTITVNDADGVNARYQTRFEVGMILQIESEYLKVVAVDTAANTVTALRGQLGSTAAAHDNGTAISSYAPMRNIEKATRDLVKWLYRNQKSSGDEIQFMDGTRVVTNKAPSNIMDTLNTYVRIRV